MSCISRSLMCESWSINPGTLHAKCRMPRRVSTHGMHINTSSWPMELRWGGKDFIHVEYSSIRATRAGYYMLFSRDIWKFIVRSLVGFERLLCGVETPGLPYRYVYSYCWTLFKRHGTHYNSWCFSLLRSSSTIQVTVKNKSIYASLVEILNHNACAQQWYATQNVP